MKWTLIDPAGTDDPDTGDIYSGLDRFGRVKDNRWIDGEGTDLDRIQYGYDRASNRIWRYNSVAASLGKEFDEIYSNDGVHRLKDMARGTLNGGRTALTSETFAQCWTLDSTGNWHGFREDSDGNGTWDLIQQRTANSVNEITDISETAGPTWVMPAYDPAGNMTTMPKVADPTVSQSCKYDAWNRLTKVSEGADTVAAYQYDGAKRRIVQKSYASGVLSETRHLYYTEPSKWQVIEERVGTSPDSADAERHFVWGLRYIDDCVHRDRDIEGDGILDERLYACQDANWNVTSLADAISRIQERNAYSAYGVPLFLTPTFDRRTVSSFHFETLYCGYYYATTGLLHVRHRVLSAVTGTWLQRDPIGHDAGVNVLEYAGSKVVNTCDPSGLLFGWGYGNYCGYSRKASCPPGTGVPPIDSVDAACERHDCCLETIWHCWKLHSCNYSLCMEVWEAYYQTCAQSYPSNKAGRDACRKAAQEIAALFCIGTGMGIPGDDTVYDFPM